MKTQFRIALAGNPNCGKTSIFNALTGARQHVGNYPGVTVESKSGSFKLGDWEIELIDLPGVYSLSSSSPEEDVVFEELTKPGIDLIVNVVDSTIPRRSLYLTTQLAELHIPMLLTFNMSDDAKKKGLKYDFAKLSKYFGSPIVETVGSRADGVQPLLNQLAITLTELDDHGVPMLTYGHDIDDAVNAVSEKIDALHVERYAHVPSRFFAIKLLEHDTAVMRIQDFQPVYGEVEAQIRHLWEKHAINADTFMADRRYAMLAGACRDCITFTQEKRREISGKIDAVMTNQFLGLPLFLLILYLMFWFTYTCSAPFMGWIEAFFTWLGDTLKSIWSPETLPLLRNMLIDGCIAGVGGVLVFLPNILFLFFAIALLEDSGYMSRAAFVMDGIMRRFGLQGRSFVPLVLGFGCNVPAIMATRVIESERDRKTTILVLPLMSCGARLPIYALIIPAFFAVKYQAFMMWLMYLIGVAIALVAAFLMKRTLFKGEGEVYLMELPPYRMPTWHSLFLHMWDRGKSYLQKAGTIILGTSIVLYLCNHFPEKKVFTQDYKQQIELIHTTMQPTEEQFQLLQDSNLFPVEELAEAKKTGAFFHLKTEGLNEERLTPEMKKVLDLIRERNRQLRRLEGELQIEKMEYTISGRVGRFLEPMFRPLGFDWKVVTASISGLAAKEVFVAQMGILYAAGDSEEDAAPLREQLIRNYSPLQGFCIMLFCLLSIPCFATLAVIRRELNSWKLMTADACGLFILAYLLSLIVYQTGSLLRIGTTMLTGL